MRSIVPLAALICLLATGCTDEPEAPPPPVRASVGVHLVSYQVPEGWEHLDHGREHRFHRELSQISASDLGPASSAGYLRELRHAYWLFQDYRLDDAHAHVSDLDPGLAFADVDEREAFLESWRKALDGGRSRRVTRGDAHDAWNHVLREVERLPDLGLAALVENRFPSIETAAHREIAEKSLVEISGRPAIRVETWDRLSHDHRQSFLFVLNEGNLFMLRMELGKYADTKPAFETLAGSLEFHSASSTS